ncbi:hypothetical protein F511_32828 [Dorcoceras hygrometricum]|uniref:Uncharacterized protein n=1 Tax=Dorcoceras hygrometricum TaxID=472368 RepID=A0A2Z7D7F7_9LAMI|nr:hypothetical protein F511_32828 [Dorcoceras hygrometricum]
MQHAINQCYECMRAMKESDSETRSVNPSQLGGRHSNPVVTTPMIALDFSGTTTQSASHNVALNQVVNQSVNQAQDNHIIMPTDFTARIIAMFTHQAIKGCSIRTSIPQILSHRFTKRHGKHTAKQLDFSCPNNPRQRLPES